MKQAISFHAAAVITPEASQALIRAGAKCAIERLRGMKSFVVRGPFQLELTYRTTRRLRW